MITTDTGSAYVFNRTGTTWTQQQKLLASDGETGDFFGFSVSLAGNTALIGARDDDTKGSAYVFTRTGTTWTQKAKLLASDGAAYDNFGCSVALDGDTALIGAMRNLNNGTISGSAYVFTRNNTTWTQQAKLFASDGENQDWFGVSVSLSDDTALIGASLDDDNGALSGSAYVFTRTGITWTQQAKLLASDGATLDYFGSSVSLSDDTALISSAWANDTKGSAYVFTRTGTTWTQETKLLASDGARGDYFGYSVSLTGNTALIGAKYDTDNGYDSGSAYVFTKIGLIFNIAGGLGVNLKLTNNGPANASGVPWRIHVEGGILGRINKTMNGTIDIPAEGSKTVWTGMFFGFGAISITVKVADEEKTTEGTQFFILTMIKK